MEPPPDMPEGIPGEKPEPPDGFDPAQQKNPDDRKPPEGFGGEMPVPPDGFAPGPSGNASDRARADFYMNDKVNAFSGLMVTAEATA